MSSEYISFDIQAEILKRLPVKPLLQFRSVSKSYKRLIDSPDFIVSYGIHHPPDDRFILLGENNYLNLVDNENNDSLVQQEFIPTVPDLISRLNVVGSSHGLLCFVGYKDILLWNPSIRKSVVIQIPDENYQIGFGVCPVTFDPTIFVIQHLEGRTRGSVFTLSTGTWRVLSTDLPRESIDFRCSQEVVIDRFIYCVAYDMLVDAEDGPSQSPFLILSFDLISKQFKEINLTGNLTSQFCSIESISKLRESLVLLEYHREFEEAVQVCSLWMMNKKCDNISFTKLYNINVPHATVNTLLGFRKTGELILETQQEDKDNGEIEIYNPNSEAIDNLGIDGDEYSFFMCSYVETLLLHDQLDGFTYWISKQSQIEDVE